jgi:hypothetical protein
MGAAVLTSIYAVIKTLVMQGAAIRILRNGPGPGEGNMPPAATEYAR